MKGQALDRNVAESRNKSGVYILFKCAPEDCPRVHIKTHTHSAARIQHRVGRPRHRCEVTV